MLSAGILDELSSIVGRDRLYTSPEELVCYSYDSSPIMSVPDVVVVPHNVHEVVEVLKLANRQRTPVVVRGAGTNVTGGTVPINQGIVLLMTGLNRILEINEKNYTATVQPGVVTAQLQAAVERAGLFYPPDPSSLSVSTIGGNVAVSAGGPRAVKYGTTKDYVVGLEVVLAEGTLIRTGGRAVRRVRGYDLTHLFVGSEGTLGVITEITVRLIPLPRAKQTILAVFERLDDAATTVSTIIASRIVPATLEIMDNITIRKIEAFRSVGYPLDADAILLIEVDGSREDVERQTAQVEDILRSNGAFDVKVARTKEETEQLWQGRRAAFAALSRSSPTPVSEDVTVPRDQVAVMMRHLRRLAEEYGLEVAVAGHAGDGNMHPLVMADSNDRDQMERVEKFYDEVCRIALGLGGTLSGEHGIGLMKARYMKLQFGKIGLEVMRAIKLALDPNHILNPGKMFPSS